MPRLSAITCAITSLAALALALSLPAWASAPALPDAQLLRISAEGGDFRQGDRVPLRIEVRSAGKAPLPPIPVTLTVDYEPYAEWKTPADLPPGQTTTWSLTWNATRGSFPFVATVDPLNEVLESDETNNTTFINIGAAGPPEPSPLPAILAGLVSFALAVALGFLFSGLVLPRILAHRQARRKPSRFARRPPSKH